MSLISTVSNQYLFHVPMSPYSRQMGKGNASADVFVSSVNRTASVCFGKNETERTQAELNEALLKLHKDEIKAIIVGSNPQEGPVPKTVEKYSWRDDECWESQGTLEIEGPVVFVKIDNAEIEPRQLLISKPYTRGGAPYSMGNPANFTYVNLGEKPIRIDNHNGKEDTQLGEKRQFDFVTVPSDTNDGQEIWLPGGVRLIVHFNGYK